MSCEIDGSLYVIYFVCGMMAMLSIVLLYKGTKSYIETLVLIRANQIVREKEQNDKNV
jgi:hypothetical protein